MSYGVNLLDVHRQAGRLLAFTDLETLLLAAWIMLNVAGWIANWDPYSFILLNLVLAIQAAYVRPIIMMSQKRQGRDRSAPLYERLQINVKAALKIKLLHQKIDTIVEQKLPELVGPSLRSKVAANCRS
jgi:uncharacterized membrane protein